MQARTGGLGERDFYRKRRGMQARRNPGGEA